MNLCDAVSAYATNLDWFLWGIFILLGMWKSFEISAAFTKWLERHL